MVEKVKIFDKVYLLDVVELVLPHLEHLHPKFTDTKIICRSPFREDSNPSFFMNYNSAYSGTWKDSGSVGTYETGNLAHLLSFLLNITLEEVLELLESEQEEQFSVERLKLPSNTLKLKKEYKNFDEKFFKCYNSSVENNYLRNRGISDNVQTIMKTFYDSENDVVGIPWLDINGVVLNVKYRSTRDKVFFYDNGRPIKNLVYGLNHLKHNTKPYAFLVEGEIDAMSLMSQGYNAICCGGSNISEEQADIIKSCGITSLLLATDNDKQGWKIRYKAIELFQGHLKLYHVNFDKSCKDVNDLLCQGKKLPKPIPIQTNLGFKPKSKTF